ncbi:SMP-30/gluconolactonase/LRE family protein [Pseudomonas kielensis]|uniref:SMP-30/gluconolactonase/LRE family protein n=1 Tax=Pseudomonas kielensis TaxID=2762577 RepID=UPI00265E6D30|nr:SMP-30/gluconolactonase/LRE family protein [Pseudomonas kielensis]WKL52915.1 SMP-30/gluconolactonase/LRE family protein [Pseudomonas kielensis]
MSIKQEQYELNVLTSGLFFGEGPRWRDGKLYISDMLGKKVYTIDASGTKTVIAQMPHKPNGMGFLPNGDLILKLNARDPPVSLHPERSGVVRRPLRRLYRLRR